MSPSRSRLLAPTALIGAAVAVGASVAIAAPGDLSRVSVADDGAQAPTGATAGVASADGRYVAFVSKDALAGVPTGGKAQLYVRDRVDGRTRLASVAPGGGAADADVDDTDGFNTLFDISTDGRYVVFASAATNLVAGDSNGLSDVFRTDMTTGAVTRISVGADGSQSNGASTDPSVSGDGSRVAFVTQATNVVTPDANAAADVVVRDTATGTTMRAASNSAGEQANDTTERPAISADGTTVAFEAVVTTTNLYDNDSNATNDIIVKTLATGVARPAAVKVGATTLSGTDVLGGNMPDISGDGRYVVFQSSAALDPADANNTDVYRRDMVAGETALMSARNGTTTAGNATSRFASVTADGTRVGFRSDATDLIATDANGAADAFLRDPASQTTVRYSQRGDGTALPTDAEGPQVAAGGGTATFASAGAFDPADSNAADDVYASERTPTDTTAPTVTVTSAGFGPNGLATVRIAGTVGPDPSGIAALTVGTTVVRPNASGAFSVELPSPPITTQQVAGGGTSWTTEVPISALDGAGNRATTTSRFGVSAIPGGKGTGPNGPATSARKAKITRVAIRRERRTIRVRFRLSTRARVQALVQRRIVVRRTKRVRWVTSTRRTVTLKAGTRAIRVTRPKRAGTYRARLIARNDAGRTTKNSRAFTLTTRR